MAILVTGATGVVGSQVIAHLQNEGAHVHALTRSPEKAKFEGNGCAISVASASLLTEAVKGKSRAQVRELFDEVHAVLTQHDANVDVSRLGKLAALSGVREFPARVKCASLCWHTLNAALDRATAPVTTE